MNLSPQELQRYARHILLRDVGGQGQQKLKNAKVLVIGAGGLGAPVLMYLAAAGVGTIGIVDDDVVDLSNLQRQIIHLTDKVGTAKTSSALQMLKQINPHVKVIEHPLRITAENAMDIVAGYDIVTDGCDNFKTRFVVSDACFFASKILVSGAVGQFDGQISTFKPHLKDRHGVSFPSYRTLHPQMPEDGALPTCAQAGILGALTGIIGSLQALEVIKEILGIGESLAGRVLMYDGLSATMFTAKLNWNAKDPLNGSGPVAKDLLDSVLR
jgi:adenylyltransferase/sulfurtransferase